MGAERFGQWVGLAVWCKFLISFFLVLLGKQLVIERIFEYNRGMQLGDSTSNDARTALAGR